MTDECGGAEGTTTIRLALGEDAEALAGFNIAMALETEQRALDPPTVQAGVAAVLADAALGFYVVAESAGDVVGALLVTFEWSDWRNGMFLWVQSVYVQPPARGNGVYRRLYEFVRSHARARGDVCGIRLYVDADNTRAQTTYARLGMIGSNYQLYEEELDR